MTTTQHDFVIVNGDTDSIAFKKPDQTPFTDAERAALLAEINALMPENIVWKDDNHYRRMLVVKAKNYVLDDGKKVKVKGNSLKATKKEPALRKFIGEVVDLLLNDKKDQVLFAYLKTVREILELKDVSDWCFKVTVTKKVLQPGEKATFQKKIKTAIGKRPVTEGDKVYLFFREDGSLCLREDFAGAVDRIKLLGKLRDTLQTFAHVLDVDLFPDFRLKRNQGLLTFLGGPKPPARVTTPPVGVLQTRTQ